MLIDIFERIENFLRRLEVYIMVPPTPAMTDMMVNIIVEVLDILGTATKEMKQSRTSEFIRRLRLLGADSCPEKFLKKVAGIRKLEDGLKKLDKMTNEEARMANAEALRVGYEINKKVDEAKLIIQRTAYSVDDVKRSSSVLSCHSRVTNPATGRQLRESLRIWQSPSDPSTNHNIACNRQHGGTTDWFCKGNIFEKWKATGSLLWVHGKRMPLLLLMASVI